MIFEVCIDSVEGALATQNAGAQRVELCDNLVEGGTTPSLGMIELTRHKTNLAVNIIIRPRGGDFYYSEFEFEVMLRDVKTAQRAGVDGVVFGLLRPDGSLDRERTKRLVDAARPMQVTFHRAFDMCNSPEETLESLVELGVERILTSGRKNSALEGASEIARLVCLAGERISIMAGGGVTAGNLPALVAATGIRECHFSARRTMDSPMYYRNRECFMGKTYQPEEYTRRVPDEELIRQVVQALGNRKQTAASNGHLQT